MVDQAHHPQHAILAKLVQIRRDVAVQQEVLVLLPAVLVHATTGMSRALIAKIERVVFAVVGQRPACRGKLRVLPHRAPLRAAWPKLGDRHAYRHAGAALVAVGPIGEGATAPKAQSHELAVDPRVDQVAWCCNL